MNYLPPMLRRLVPAGLVLAALGLALEGTAAAEQPWVDAPLTLQKLHFAADAGVAFGTYQNAASQTQIGWGSSFSAAIGLPFLGELGATIAQRFGQDGVLVGTGPDAKPGPLGADHFARLFDPITGEPGSANFANPEFHLRGTLVPLDVFELGLETRLIVPTSDGSFLTFTPGVPIRVHVPGFLRIDTGLWLPVFFTPSNGTQYILEVPAAAYFSVGDAFFGPQTGLRFVGIGGNGPSSTDIPLGVGGGYTFGGIFDVKAQLRTERVNSSGWASQAFGGGIGVGLRIP